MDSTQINNSNTLEALDCISRQAAIDAIEITPFDDYGDYMRARELIEQLPSAQPDVPDTNVGDMISRQEGMMRECTADEITIEKLLNIVHSYTDPIRIEVIMGDAWLTCDEARRMHNFVLTKRYRDLDKEEQERLLKYYKDVPVWNLTVWHDGPHCTEKGRTYYAGIEARCYYKDLREGWLAEKADRERQRRKEYREKKKNERNE